MRPINELQCVCDWGSAPDPAGGAYSAPPDPLTRFGELKGLWRDKEGKGEEMRGWKWGRKGKSKLVWGICVIVIKGKGKRYCIAVNGSIPWHSYGVSLVIWDHTVLPATRHK